MRRYCRRGDRISVVGIPKTIDNDIYFIPHSFGFETAVDKAVDALRCAHVEASSVDNGIGVVKLMGRESGFIAASASLALREVSFVLVPEAPFSPARGERTAPGTGTTSRQTSPCASRGCGRRGATPAAGFPRN